METFFAILNGTVKIVGLVWNHGGPIALKHVLVPVFVTTYNVRGMLDNNVPGVRVYRTGYVFGIRIFRYQVAL